MQRNTPLLLTVVQLVHRTAMPRNHQPSPPRYRTRYRCRDPPREGTTDNGDPNSDPCPDVVLRRRWRRRWRRGWCSPFTFWFGDPQPPTGEPDPQPFDPVELRPDSDLDDNDGGDKGNSSTVVGGVNKCPQVYYMLAALAEFLSWW